MTPGMVIAVLGAVFVAPLVWAAVVALARRAAIGWGVVEPLDDVHEKAVLALMLAPIVFGAVLLCLPQEAIYAAAPPPLLNFREIAGGATRLEPGDFRAPFDWISFVGLGLLVVYTLGVARFLAPLIAAHVRLSKWSAAATAHAELTGVYVSEQAATPLAVSGQRVLLPRALIETLSATQINLIVAHERHHHARGDVGFYAALAWVEALLWCNPFVSAQARHCRLAAELDCDAAATASAPEMRKTYAQTLLAVLKHSAGNAVPVAPAVFSHRAAGEHHMRILKIMKTGAGAAKRTPWLAYVAAFALVAPLGLAQLALAQSGSGASDQFALTAPASATGPRPTDRSPMDFDRSMFSHRPLEGRITGAFGARPDAFTGQLSFHPGVDIAAPMGAPIYAPADGHVIRVSSNSDYGNMIEIDHGDGFALRYAHLSAFDVREGERIRAGQIIGRVGNSGRSSGTHLHIEVWRFNRAWDPRLVLDLPAE